MAKISFKNFLKKTSFKVPDNQNKQLLSDTKWYYIGNLPSQLKDEIILLLFFDDELVAYERAFKGIQDDILGVRSKAVEKLFSDAGAELITPRHKMYKYVTPDKRV